LAKYVDLSVQHSPHNIEPAPPFIEHLSHRLGAINLSRELGLHPLVFPDQMAFATDTVFGDVHSGTHVDAPWHYGPMSEGKPARTLDQVPLEWCYGNGVIIDMRYKNPGDEITVEDLENATEKLDHRLGFGDIVLIHTGCAKYWGTPEYMKMQSGLGIAGTAWILEKGVRCIGIDAWTVDRPMMAMVEDFKKTGDQSLLWPSHFYGRVKEYLQIEKLANLDLIPKSLGFKVAAFPVKFIGASAGWTRAVAIIDD